MEIRDAMSTDVLTVVEREPLTEAARRMAEGDVGAAIVEPERSGGAPGILTERDVVRMVGAGHDPQSQLVAEHCTSGAASAAPNWSLERAAQEMTSGEHRHLVVVEGDATVGLVSMRDIVGSWTSRREIPTRRVQIRAAMSTEIVMVEHETRLREVARLMIERGSGAAVVERPERRGPPGIITERVLLRMVGAGKDPDIELVADHVSTSTTYSAPDWSLEQAAEAMTRGGFQHVIVVADGSALGVISMCDIVGRWMADRAAN